jgi:Spondin_N
MKKLNQLRRAAALAGLALYGLTLGASPSDAQMMDNRVYEVTITNLTAGQLLSPPVLAAHSSDFAVFEVGERASEGIWTVAEQGNPMTLAEQLRQAPEVASVVVADGPVHRIGGSGESSRTIRIESHGADRLSVAMMLGCTNDGFTGLSSVPLSRSMTPVTYYGAAYDAGTERNNQLWSSLPDGCNALGPAPRDADGQNGRDLTDEPITMHAGIVPGVGDLGPQFAWDEAVVRVTVQRVE